MRGEVFDDRDRRISEVFFHNASDVKTFSILEEDGSAMVVGVQGEEVINGLLVQEVPVTHSRKGAWQEVKACLALPGGACPDLPTTWPLRGFPRRHLFSYSNPDTSCV